LSIDNNVQTEFQLHKAKNSQYLSHKLSSDGKVVWSAGENRIWQDLFERQLNIIKGRACGEFMHGLELLDLPRKRPPQLSEVNQVPCLIKNCFFITRTMHLGKYCCHVLGICNNIFTRIISE
jgi:phenylalanine-4-hydroxylase